VTPHSLVETCRCFGGVYCFYLPTWRWR